MQTLKVDASAESETVEIAAEIENAVGFLRRFASMMSGGENADRLHNAANLIEDMADALDKERKQFRDVDTRLMQSIRAHATAQVEIGSARAEFNVLQTEMAEQQRKAAAAREAVLSEAQAQSARADKAERAQREASDELLKLQTKLSEIGQSFVVLPVATMHALRAQFEFLGREFGKAGDATSQAMCEIGACTIAEAVAASLKETAGKG